MNNNVNNGNNSNHGPWMNNQKKWKIMENNRKKYYNKLSLDYFDNALRRPLRGDEQH
ncbi:hypothetical protein Glove_48g195 [Diversispora epigaea]|uniref:Uncharacterized protein n=1 Tax=Diversispora epigaea TaxID=1348612 RepID=A0A397JNY0_9GLOM|nr:hypothetical protein Glove_48g195 [Diversispora epigaea]